MSFQRTINIILDRVYDNKLRATQLEKQTSKKVIHMSRLLQFYMENMILRSGNFQLTS